MSTLKADAVTTKSDNTDLTITGGGTGVPNLEAGFKVGGTVGVPISGLQVGTDGELITWDASGDPAAVAVGTATHVLTSNGAGAAPTFQAAGGGAWTVISSTTISSPTTNIDFTGLTSTYKMYALVGTSLHGDSDGADLKMRVGTGAGPTYDTGGSSYAYHLGAIRAGDAAYAAIASAAASGFQIHSGLDALATAPSNFIVYVMDPSNATFDTMIYIQGTNVTNADASKGGAGIGHYLSATAVTAIRFYIDSDDFETGTVTLYGIANS